MCSYPGPDLDGQVPRHLAGIFCREGMHQANPQEGCLARLKAVLRLSYLDTAQSTSAFLQNWNQSWSHCVPQDSMSLCLRGPLDPSDGLLGPESKSGSGSGS